MTNLSFSETLKSNGWTEESTASFPEKAGKDATTYFTYSTKRNTSLTFAVFTATKNIRFRIYDPGTKEVSWLEIGMNANVDKVILKIVESQEEITQAEAFGFYFQISGLGEVAILAWEQYEDNYR